MWSALCLLATTVVTVATAAASVGRAPNIVFMLADDLGWNDVSFHGSPQIPTPHIDSLARSGVELDRYYVAAVCSPTRASLLTGRSVIHHGVFSPFAPLGNKAEGLNLSYTLLPEYLKEESGYRTYIVGKWHLGMKTTQYQPSARGFDKYYGFYAGCSDYWTHRSSNDGRDLHEGGCGMGVLPERLASDFASAEGKYATFVYADKASSWIREHAKEHPDDPMFMYVAFQSIHSANNKFLQAPDEYLGKFPHVDPEAGPPCGQYDTKCKPGAKRRSVAAIVNAMDDAVGNIVSALDASGLMDNTIVVFSSDNGGPVNFNGNMANNFPLRGGKAGYFEGGVRGVGLITGPGTGASRVSKDLFHVTDWAPSLLTAVKRAVTGDPEAKHEMRVKTNEVPFRTGDGIDNWDAISLGRANRKEIIHTAQAEGSEMNNFAIMSGKFKLVWNAGGTEQGWAPPPGMKWNYTSFTVNCKEPPSEEFGCTQELPCLFDLDTDPCEQRNIAGEMPEKVLELKTVIAEYVKTTILPWSNFSEQDERADPKNFNNTLSPWMSPSEDLLYYPSRYTGPGY